MHFHHAGIFSTYKTTNLLSFFASRLLKIFTLMAGPILVYIVIMVFSPTSSMHSCIAITTVHHRIAVLSFMIET